MQDLKRTGVFVYCRKGRLGHVIGEVVWLNDAYPEALYLYEESLIIEPKVLPDCRVIVIGDAHGIICTLCSKKKRWGMSEKAIKAMFVNDPEKRKELDEMLKNPKYKETVEKFLRLLNL